MNHQRVSGTFKPGLVNRHRAIMLATQPAQQVTDTHRQVTGDDSDVASIHVIRQRLQQSSLGTGAKQPASRCTGVQPLRHPAAPDGRSHHHHPPGRYAGIGLQGIQDQHATHAVADQVDTAGAEPLDIPHQ